jgi:hypothetical protein
VDVRPEEEAMEIRKLVERVGPATTAYEAEELLEHPEAEEAHVLAVLRKRNLAGAAIETIARHERWGGRYMVKAAVVNHPKTPKTLALRLVGGLFWKELLRVTGNHQLSMPLRVAAEKHLVDRLAKLELGEKISLARSAPPRVISILTAEAQARVIDALLTNPRLREMEVLRMAENSKVSPEALRVIASSERWASRYPIKLALVKNPRTPVHTALRLLSSLPRRDVKKLMDWPELPRVVYLGGERILKG